MLECVNSELKIEIMDRNYGKLWKEKIKLLD